MSNASASSAKTSATIPARKPANRRRRNELEYLQQQAGDAKAAAVRTAREIGAGLGRSVDVRAWTAEHPWAALSTAAVAGFATVAVAVPSKRQRGTQRPAPSPREGWGEGSSADSARPASEPPLPKPGFGSLLLRELAKTVIGLAFSVAASAVGRLAESPNGTASAGKDVATDTGQS